MSPSATAALLTVAALVAFVARTPLKVVLVDRWRGRRLARTVVAQRVVAAELTVLAVLAILAAGTARGPFWAPLVVAAPLVAAELWFDMRSRSRRLLPELAGTVAIGSVVAAIVLADGGTATLAVGLWVIVAARAVAAVPFVRLQLDRAKRTQHQSMLLSDGAQVAAVGLAGAAAVVNDDLAAGSVAVAGLAVFHLAMARRKPPAATVLGVQQVVLGLFLVLVTALGVTVF